MTSADETSPENHFTPALLPWLLAAGMLAVYLLTINHWVAFNSLFTISRVSGWNWQPELQGPLYWLITAPFQLLPLSWIPLALNLLSVLCAGLTLALLARSVALLPQDRTEEQRIRERSDDSSLSIPAAWLPPVLAVLVCGLQLTFWENATIASKDMLDLLVFAYIIRCLLEYRIEGRDSWLLRAALVYGAGMANDWGMVGFFPAYIAALIWIKGLTFFNGRFLSRMFLVGVAGLSLYLLLPLVSAVSSSSPVTFWQALKYNLASQKQFLFLLPFSKTALLHGLADRPLWVLALPTLLPVVIMSIRWPRFSGDISKLGIALANNIFHLFHGAVLLVCLWVALDPDKFSPRHLLPGLPMLTLYYLGALSIGYYSGYLLLVFGARPHRRFHRPQPAYLVLLSRAVVSAVYVLLVAVPLLLVYRNLPAIRTTNGPMLRQFAALTAEHLPAQGAVLLSDEPVRLALLESALTQAGMGQKFLFIDTSGLRTPEYHRFLKSRYPLRWPSNPSKDVKKIYDSDVLPILSGLAASNSLYYLHPSFGYYFELFYGEPHGLVYHLKNYPSHQIDPPPLSKGLIAENEDFWKRADDVTLNAVDAAGTPPVASGSPGLIGLLEQRAHLGHEANLSALLLGKFYARALDSWGVELQRQGLLKEAQAHFDRALDLNPDNVAAKVNLECNRHLQAGESSTVPLPKAVQDQLAKYRSGLQMLRDNGPFDEPSFCLQEGQVFVESGSYRQAAQQFERVTQLAPDHLPSRLLLGRLCIVNQMPDRALQITDEIRQQPERFGFGPTNEAELLWVQTAAWLAKKDSAAAAQVVQSALNHYPDNQDLLTVATRLFMNFGYYSNAVAILDDQLKQTPDDPGTLVNKGYAYLQLKSFAQAIPPLTRVLEMNSSNFPPELHYSALFNRAIAYLRTDKLDEAQQDYEQLHKAFPAGFQFYYGLAEIAYRKKDTNAAVQNYQLYLAHAPTNTAEASFVVARLKELQPGSP